MEALLFLAGLLVGSGLTYWLSKRPRKFVAEDRDAGLKRYQESKRG